MSTPDHQSRAAEVLRRYWRMNIRLMGILLGIWAIVGLGCGVLFADVLNAWSLLGSGYPLGFWFAQQGAIIVFVLLILAYALLMNRIERQHREELHELKNREGENGR